MVLKNFFKALGRVFGLRKKRRSSTLRRKPNKRVFRKKRHPHKRKPALKVRRVRRRAISKNRQKVSRRHKVRKQNKGKRLPVVLKKPAQLPLLGEITHYFPKVKAAVFVCKASLSVGEPIWVKGQTTNFRQTVSSMQVNRKPIDRAKKGEEIGLEVLRDVRVGDEVYRMQMP